MDDLDIFSASKSEILGRVIGVRTVGVFRWVLDSTISKKSAAVGTGAIALRPLVDILA